jgi:Tol biopolymer transport system component
MDYNNDGYQDLLLLTEDGATIWPVIYGNASQNPYFSDWSPDGEWLLYTNKSGIFSQLYRIKPAGTNNTYISLQGYNNNLNGDYSGNGTTIAFQRGEGASGKIYTMPANGSSSAADTGFLGLWPRWSPDNSTLIYYKSDNNIYTLSSGTETQITSSSDLQIYPSYTASNMIVYCQSNGTQYDIYSANITNIGEAVNLTNSTSNELYPSLAPGNRIIYLVDNQTIAVMNLDGSNKTNLYDGPRPISNPRWFIP